MKKILFLLLILIPLSCIGQATHKNGVTVEDSLRVEGFVRIVDSLIAEGIAKFKAGLQIGDSIPGSDIWTVDSIVFSATDTAMWIKGHRIALGLSVPGGGGGASAFTDLTDSPNNYTNKGGYVVRVDILSGGVEFQDSTVYVKTYKPNTYTAGKKQTVQSNATTAGFRFVGYAGNPSALVAGDMWYNTAQNKIYYRGATSAWELVNRTQAQTLTTKTINLSQNTVSGTMGQFNTALSDGDFAFVGGAFHDGFSDFVAEEHLRWDQTGGEDIHDDRIQESSITQHEGAIDHGNLLNTHDTLRWFNVVAFGATGDGVTDDRAAIQAAIDAAVAAGGGTIFLPAGIYNMEDSLILRNASNIRIIGEGKEVTTITNDGFISDRFFALMLDGMLEDIEIAGIKFETTGTSAGAERGGLLQGAWFDESYLFNVDGLNIHDCEFYAPDADIVAIFLTPNLDNSYLRNFTFENNYVDSIGQCGLGLTGHDDASDELVFQNININNNHFSYTGLSGSWGMCITMSGLFNQVTMTGNTFYNWQKDQAVEIRGTKNATISDNKFENKSITTNGLTFSYVGDSICEYITVVGNTFDIPWVESSDGYVAFWARSTNYLTFADNVARSMSVWFQDCLYGTVTGNVIIGEDYFGLHLQDSTQHFLIDNNIIDLTNATGGGNTPQAAVVFNGEDCKYNEVTNTKVFYTEGSMQPVRYYNGAVTDNIFEMSTRATRTSSNIDELQATFFPGENHFIVTSTDPSRYMRLPATFEDLIGKRITGSSLTNGFPIRVDTSEVTTVSINGMDSTIFVPPYHSFEAILIDTLHWTVHIWDSIGNDVNDGVFNVKDYGATGDGSTDDITAINTALAVADGAVLYFPAGTYVISADITAVVDNVRFLGDGPQQTTIYLDDGSDDNIITIGGDNWIIENIGFDGNSANNTGVYSCIYNSGYDSLMVRDCYFFDPLTAGIHIVTSGDNVRIVDNKFSGCPLGIIGDDGNDIRIDRNDFSGCITPIDIDDSDVTRCMITGNNWYGCTNDALTTSATNPLITDNVDKTGAWYTVDDK